MSVVPFFANPRAPIRASFPFEGCFLPPGSRDCSAAVVEDVDQAKDLLRQAENLIAQQKETIRRLENQVVVDPQTGLLNRRGLMSALRRSLAAIRRNARQAGVLVLADVSKLASINEAYGRSVGDGYLQTFGSVLLDIVRSSDDVARLEGGAFAILMPQMGAKAVADRLQSLEKMIGNRVMHHHGEAIPLRAAFGFSLLDEESTPESVLVAAEMNLFSAKGKKKALHAAAV